MLKALKLPSKNGSIANKQTSWSWIQKWQTFGRQKPGSQGPDVGMFEHSVDLQLLAKSQLQVDAPNHWRYDEILCFCLNKNHPKTCWGLVKRSQLWFLIKLNQLCDLCKELWRHSLSRPSSWVPRNTSASASLLAWNVWPCEKPDQAEKNNKNSWPQSNPTQGSIRIQHGYLKSVSNTVYHSFSFQIEQISRLLSCAPQWFVLRTTPVQKALFSTLEASFPENFRKMASPPGCLPPSLFGYQMLAYQTFG